MAYDGIISPELKKVMTQWHQLKSEHSSDELISAVRNNRNLIAWIRCKRFLLRWTVRLVLLTIVFYSLKQPVVYDTAMTHVRLVMKHLIRPVWQWDNFYEKECLLSNPNHNPYHMNPEDCDRCGGIYSVLHINLANITEASYTEFLDMDRPIVIRPDMKTLQPEWWLTATQSGYTADINSLHDFYVHNPVFRVGVVCKLTTDIELQVRNQKLLLLHIKETKKKNWFAHWEHCGRNQTRAFREIYSRPSYLPSSFDLTQPSWLFLSESRKEDDLIPVEIGGRAMLIGQIHGESTVALVPRNPCRDEKSGCTKSPLFVQLKPGDMLSVTNSIWELYLRHTAPGFNIAMGLVVA